MIKAKGERGFSLLELIVAVLLTVGLTGAVLALMNRNQQVFVSESNVTDMHQNLRVAMDLLTRDVQASGMGLPRSNGSFAAVFYKDGANTTPDTIMIVNGDPYAPAADVTDKPASGTEFLCMLPPDVTTTGSGTSIQFTYLGQDNQSKTIYKSFSTESRYYICYDDTKARVMALSANATLTGTGTNTRLRLLYNPANYTNPPGVFGSLVDTGEPDYNIAKIAPLGSLVAYRLNRATEELERTEDLVNWYSVARGITDFQMQYRVVSKNGAGQIVESLTNTPTDRKNIRAVEITLSAETPDLDSTTKGYKQFTQRFEVAPRNFNLLNNTNLSSNLN
jgi:type II secretory pathway pseudopilin PulG